MPTYLSYSIDVVPALVEPAGGRLGEEEEEEEEFINV